MAEGRAADHFRDVVLPFASPSIVFCWRISTYLTTGPSRTPPAAGKTEQGTPADRRRELGLPPGGVAKEQHVRVAGHFRPGLGSVPASCSARTGPSTKSYRSPAVGSLSDGTQTCVRCPARPPPKPTREPAGPRVADRGPAEPPRAPNEVTMLRCQVAQPEPDHADQAVPAALARPLPPCCVTIGSSHLACCWPGTAA
jgi:hypothetical protein